MQFIPYGKHLITDEDVNEVINVLKSNFLTTGPKVEEFENLIATYVNAKYCVSVSSGTAALHLSSLVLLEENVKVLTTPNSFLATSNAILYAKAKPVFIDIEDNGNLNLDLCEEELKNDSTVKAMYVVHFSGNPINQKKLEFLRKTYNVKILEDCAHSLGAVQGEVKVGSCKNSDLSIFSFHPVKHLTTAEGGAITTNSKEIYEKLIQLRNHGMKARPDIAPWHYDMEILGFNYRLNDLSCALGISQFNKLDSFLSKRRSLAKKYDNYFKDIKSIEPLYKFTNESAYHLYIIKIDFENLCCNKKDFVIKMREKKIGLQFHYIPINKQPYYKNLGYGEEKTPKMDDYYAKAISLPLFPSLTFYEQEYVVNCIREILDV